MKRNIIVTRKSRTLFQFNSRYECSKTYYALKDKLRRMHRMTVDAVDIYMRSEYGFQYDNNGYEFNFKDFTDFVKEDDLVMRSMGETYATILLNIDDEEKEPEVTMDDFANFVRKELKEAVNTFIKDNKNFDKEQLDDITLLIKIEDRKMDKPIIFKEVTNE